MYQIKRHRRLCFFKHSLFAELRAAVVGVYNLYRDIVFPGRPAMGVEHTEPVTFLIAADEVPSCSVGQCVCIENVAFAGSGANA